MAPPSPYDDPVPRGWKFVQGTLRVAVCMQCAGLALIHLSGTRSSDAARLLQSLATTVEGPPAVGTQLAGYGLAVAALFTLLRPSWPVLFCVVLWFGGEAAAPLTANTDWQVVELLTGVLPIMLPLALLLVDFWPPPLAFSIGRAQAALALLRLALVISVTAQGMTRLVEIAAPGPWSDLVRDASARLSINVTDGHVQQILAGMFAADLALGFAALATRNRLGMGALAAWIVASAALWIVARGSSGYGEFLLSASGAGAPLAILLFWICAVKEQPPVIVPG